MKQFYDMCRQFGWKREKDEDGNVEEDPERTVARARLQAAMVTQFNSTYGIGVNDLQAWQSLCRALEVERIPDNLEECRKIVMLTHVNICDLVDAPTLGKPELFDTERALADYTKRTGKFFSREKVPAGTLLRFLLRRILDPPTTKEEGGSRGSGPAVL
ncbi:hypothetical protein C8Q80DRAFT_1157049 [Daedaleopsis nitida]|nr:hypothetical protein C8Q80DRAFT_1157049 [Daedaleopsis nitida]